MVERGDEFAVTIAARAALADGDIADATSYAAEEERHAEGMVTPGCWDGR